MSSWIGQARSNYFKVKDVEAFKEWCSIRNLECLENSDGVGFVTLEEYGNMPSFWYDEDDNDCEINYEAELPEFLKKGEVAILMEAGSEKARFITGWAQAIHSSGDTFSICLNDVYTMAKAKWDAKKVSVCEY